MLADLEQLKYPIGKFTIPTNADAAYISENLIVLQECPTKVREAIQGLTVDQLQTPYRPEGWSCVQVVNHLADSHANGFLRTKLALTEENPTIKPYNEKAWAQLPDGTDAHLEPALLMLESIHQRWVRTILKMKKEDFSRTYYHPENKITYSLSTLIGLYAWHSKHHVAHIVNLRTRMNW